MAFEKYTTTQLKRYQRILLITSIVGLILMIIALVYGMYLEKTTGNNTLIFLVPTVFGPIAIFPSVFSASIGSELKKRNKN